MSRDDRAGRRFLVGPPGQYWHPGTVRWLFVTATRPRHRIVRGVRALITACGRRFKREDVIVVTYPDDDPCRPCKRCAIEGG